MVFKFTAGSRVEVRSDDEGFKGSFYVATILEEPKFEQCVVVYDQLTETEDPNSRNLSETVHISRLRPLPPLNKGEMIKVHDTVDAYYNDGWWPGEVIEAFQDGKFLVYFADPPDQQMVERIDLRHHLEWANGKWRKPRKKNTKVLANFSEPLKSNRTKNLGRKVQAGKYCGAVGKTNNNAVRVDEPDMHVHEESGTLSDTPVKRNQKRQIRDQSKENMEGSSGMKRTQNRKRGRPQKLSLENQIGKDNIMPRTVDNEPAEDTFMLTCKDYMNLIVSERKILSHLCRHNELLSRINVSSGEDQSNKTGTSTRGEKFPNESLSDAHPELMPNSYQAEDQVGKEWLIECHGETGKTVDIESQNQGVTTNIPVAEDQENQTLAENEPTTNGKKKMSKNLESASKDQGILPLYQCTNATHGESDNGSSSAFATDIIQFSPLQKTVANYPRTSSAIVSCDGKDINENVPFFKSSPLWTSLDSMEIYSKTRRKPHFSPLLNCREETREGLAIAHMVTFSTVVEKTLNLRFSDPSSVITNNLKTVAELDKHGFDVEPVRARLMMLLAKKEKEIKLNADYKMIGNEITNNVLEKDKLEQEIIQINRKMKELAEKLTEIDSKKAMKEIEILTLRSRQETIRENVCVVEQEFKSAADCPF